MSEHHHPEPLSESDARMWALLAHLSGIVIPIIGGAVIMAVFGPRSEFVKKEAVEALNFQITYVIAVFISAMLTIVIIGVFLLPVVLIGGIVFMVIGGLKAHQGEAYRYPFALRLVK